jgi:hypothetical protein
MVLNGMQIQKLNLEPGETARLTGGTVDTDIAVTHQLSIPPASLTKGPPNTFDVIVAKDGMSQFGFIMGGAAAKRGAAGHRS